MSYEAVLNRVISRRAVHVIVIRIVMILAVMIRAFLGFLNRLMSSRGDQHPVKSDRVGSAALR